MAAKYRIEISRDDCTIVEGDGPDEMLAAAEACLADAIILYDAVTGEKIWPKD
jgi:hypothetical protein